MDRDQSDRVRSHFSSISCELTPASARHAAFVLFAPVSTDPAVSEYCASVLSRAELLRASRFANRQDTARFEQRRAFRRFCGARVLGSSKSLSGIQFNETDNGRPYLSAQPGTWFSFSSCRLGFLAAWSSTHGLGVDIEDQTKNFETVDLAHHFFTSAEASVVEGVEGRERLQTFLRLWTLKEAALKSIGQGLPFGLDAFAFELTDIARVIDVPIDHGRPEQYESHVIDENNLCASLVTRSLVLATTPETDARN